MDQALLDSITKANLTKGVPWTAGATSMLQLSAAERLIRLGYVPGPGQQSLADREKAAAAAPAQAATAPAPAGTAAQFDWRNVSGRSFISSIKDQGSCGSCVAFGTAATMDAGMRITKGLAVGDAHSNLLQDVSEAQLFYCGAEEQGRRCAGPNGGWWPDAALAYCQATGLAPEACFPYTAGDQACHLAAGWQSQVTKVGGYESLNSAAAMKAWISTKGPVVTCFSVYADFYAYTSGVYRYNGSAPFEGGHCVCVVGYSDIGQFWICKNSWGPGWGEGGYFCIAYGNCGIDATMWAVTSFASVYELPSGFMSLGGDLTTNPCVASDADGRLEVFARGTDNALWHIWQTAPNGAWSSWASLGGKITTDPIAGRNADGRLEVFARGADNALWHIWQTAPNSGWSGWSSLGGSITSDPTVVNDADGRLEVFARGTDNALWHIWQTAPNSGWGNWASLGGKITSNISVFTDKDGRVEAFARGTDNALWHIWQTAPNSGWSGWDSLGGTISADPTVKRNADGRLEAFARGTDNALWHIWQTAPNGGWSGWDSLGGTITSPATVGKNADGRLEAFVLGTDHALWHRWQTAPNGGWS